MGIGKKIFEKKKIQLLFETEVKVIINVLCLKAVGKWILVFLSGSKTALKGREAETSF